MFKIRNRLRKISARRFVKSILTGDYRWKYPQAVALVKILLADKLLLQSVKRKSELDWESIEKDIDNLILACGDSNIAEFIAQVIDARGVTFDKIRFLFEKASQSKSDYLVVNLLNYNGDLKLDTRDNYSNTLLHEAARNGLANVCQVLIEKKIELNGKGEYGFTPLHLAIKNGHLEVIRKLIPSGANVNAEDNKGLTPLHKVASYGYLEVAKLLLVHSADVNAKNAQTPPYLAVEEG